MTTEHDILIVEDEPFFTRMCVKTLSKPGRRIRTVSDGKRAVEEIQKSAPHLLILDLLLPELDGFSVLDFLKAQGSTFPVVILSNLGAGTQPSVGGDFKAAAYCVKSDTSLAELSEIVDSCLKGATALQ